MKKRLFLVILAILLGFGMISLGSTTRPPTPWGIYTGWQVSDVVDFEKKIGRSPNFIATFVHWGNENQFPLELANFAKSNDQTLVIFWEAMDYNKNTPEDSRFSYDSILAGKWDKYLSEFAKSVRDYDYPLILVPFEEMNGNWYPWSGTQNNNSPVKHINAYRYLKKFFTAAPGVKFGWSINSESDPNTSENAITAYYPGDAYVDYVGVNGFNFGEPWQTFGQIFDPALRQLETFGRPVIIFSMACAPGPQKAGWITDALAKINKNPKIAGWIWFNENKEKDWRIWSDPKSLEKFQKSLLL